MSARDHLTRGGRIGTVALAGAAILLAGGSFAIGVAVTAQHHAPQPPASAAGRIDGLLPTAPAGARPPTPTAPADPRPARIGPTEANPAPPPPAETSPAPPPPAGTGPAPTPPARTGPAALGWSVPRELRIPAIGVTARLGDVALQPDGTIGVPQPGPDYDHPAWFSGSPTPGELGPSVIVGHVDSAANGPSVFFRLGDLRPGDRIQVSRADGSTALFTVQAVRSYAKTDFPTQTVYGETSNSQLRLITCGGSFSPAGHYDNNTVVFADLTAPPGHRSTPPAATTPLTRIPPTAARPPARHTDTTGRR